MSSQFSYELDERHIRIMMQDAEVEGNDVLWDKFEGLTATESKSTVNMGHLVPSFNLSVSRSIIVPVLFVALIGGLSAMLFSFVDFKKKESIDKEIPLVANPDNYKKPEVIVEKIEKPTENKIVPATKDIASIELSTATVTNSLVPTQTPEVKKEEPVKAFEEKSKTEAVTTLEPQKEVPQKIIPKKKTRKVKAEILPTIDATTITDLNEGVSEPELDLK